MDKLFITLDAALHFVCAAAQVLRAAPCATSLPGETTELSASEKSTLAP
jgi:hypothetical protein